MKFVGSVVGFSLVVVSVVFGRDAQAKSGDKDAAASPRSKWVFSLMPRAFQKNPLIDLNVITEMTEAGKQAVRPTADRPVYYVTQSAGFHALGQGAPANEKPPAVADMERLLKESLATNHYLPEASDHPATLVLIYYWGSYTTLSPTQGDDENAPEIPGPVLVRELMERAAVVGGDAFAHELALRLIARHDMSVGLSPPRGDPTGAIPGIPSILGDMGGNFADIFDPLQRFMDESPKNRHLVEEAFGSIYFVIASAYEYESLARGARKLLWRTKMSVGADGVSIAETLPPLVTNAGAYFGREMKGAEVITQRLLREGRVEIGTPSVVEFIEEAPKAAAPPAAEKKDEAKP